MFARKLLGALTTVSLLAAPTVAAAQAAPAPVERAGAESEGSALYGRGSLLTPIALLAGVILILILVSVDFGDDDDDEPVSA